MSRRFWTDPWVWAAVLAAAVLRGAYLADLQNTPFFAYPQMDALYHHQWAERLASGDWLGNQVFFRAPLYPYFLGMLYALDLGPLGIRVVQFFIGVGTVVLVQRFAYYRWGKIAAVTAGALTGLYGPLVYFEGELLLVVLETVLFLAGLWGWQRAWEHPSVFRWLAAGAWLGLAALVRPIVLPVAAMASIAALVRFRGRGWLPAAAYVMGVLLVVSPVLIRNAAVGKDFVPVASQGGWNYYLGNHAGADGMAALKEGFRPTWSGGLEEAQREAERGRGRPLKPSEVSRYWYEQAFTWASADPGPFFKHQLKKAGYFFDAYEIPNNQNYYFFSRLARVFRAPFVLEFGVLGPLALAGFSLGLMRRRLPFPVAVLPWVLSGVIVAFFVCGRFRAPLTPLFALWAGIGAACVPQAWRLKQWKPLLISAVILCLTGLYINGDVHGFARRHSDAESHLRLGVFYASQGDAGAALREYRAAVEANPRFVEGWNNMGTVLAGQGKFPAAREAWAAALRIDPGHPKSLSNMAALEYQAGNPGEAVHYARKVLQEPRRDADALFNAGVVLGNSGEFGAARECFERLVDLQPGNPEAVLGLARAWISLGHPDRASEALNNLPPERRTVEVIHLLESLAY